MEKWISINEEYELNENDHVELLFSNGTVKTIVYSEFSFILSNRLLPLVNEFGMYTHYRKKADNV